METWMKWTFFEAATRTVSLTIQKSIGLVSGTFGHSVFTVFLVGIVQAAIGFLGCRGRRMRLAENFENVLGSVLFGIFAFAANLLQLTAFLLGAEVGVSTFIITLAIFPGAAIDRIFFRNRLAWRQWLGILVAVVAGYTVLEWPSFREAVRMPLWVWIVLFNTLLLAVNQGITQKIKQIDPFAKNFWGGLTTAVLGAACLALLPLGDILRQTELPSFILLSVALGATTALMWTFNLMSYKRGAYIAFKKLLMNGSFLSLGIAVGVIWFGETPTVFKAAGIILFLVAFTLVDERTWLLVSRKK